MEHGNYQEPLISNRMALAGMAALALMAAATFAITLAAGWIGPRLAIGSHTASSETIAVLIGQDELRVPENTIRFREQRHQGRSERLDLYLTWPEMQGYSPALKSRFDDTSSNDGLIFLQLSQSTMSEDMSGRLAPIYARLFDGEAMTGPYGLTAHRLRRDSGYGDEVILNADRPNGASYVVRCLMPKDIGGGTAMMDDRGKTRESTGSLAAANSASCQRDIRAGQDLTVLYRFSPTLLRDWDHIDAAIDSFVQNHVVKPQKAKQSR
ncbi:hypothetical protein ACQKKX_10150 [Neorhizobium sp. NPDC001467]|uniref:hypothetical protein n=1 Tax=Neorhizobium sp. NPDC001467 TaxID=3390595 RepID=UPI003D0609EB